MHQVGGVLKKNANFAPTNNKNLTPKFVFRTGTPGDYAAKLNIKSEKTKFLSDEG